MEENFEQSITIAHIFTTKNYSYLSERRDNKFQHFTGHEFESSHQSNIRDGKMVSLRLYEKNKYSVFFYTNDIIFQRRYNVNYQRGTTWAHETVKLRSLQTNFFITTNDRHIRRHYGNPFSHIIIEKVERQIKKNGDKITIKAYKHTKERKINSKYFIKKTDSTIVTFNLLTGNFLVVNYNTQNKKKPKNFCSNSFMSLETAISAIYGISKPSISDSKQYKDLYKKEFDNETFQCAIEHVFNFNKWNRSKLSLPLNENHFSIHNAYINEVSKFFVSQWTLRFINCKNIKLPDTNGIKLLTSYYPTEKYLKKNDGKLIASILDRYKIKSKFNIMLLHKYPNASITSIIKLCRIFGKNHSKYISNIPTICFLEPHGTGPENFHPFRFDILELKPFELKSFEKENVIKIIKDYITIKNYFAENRTYNLNIDGLINMIIDHIVMMNKIREYYPDVQFRSTTHKTFENEHSQLSDIERQIENKWAIEYIFSENTLKKIEKPIDVEDQIFYPKILKTTEDYYEEGKHMHHCVNGYINYENSVIISLRYNEKERVTCEFNALTKECVQSRYFSNQVPPPHYNEALKKLKHRVHTYTGRIKSIEKIRKPNKINGKIVSPNDNDNPIEF